MGVATLRMLRRERGWTLEVLAERAGMTKSYLSKVERGHSTPSIAVALSLAGALGVDVAALFGELDGTSPIEIDRATGRDAGAAATPSDGSTYLGIATGIAGKQMLPFVLYPPADATPCTFRDHDGDEFVVVLSGEVELRFPDRVERLAAGDSAYFRGGVAHYFRSVGPDPAEVLAVIAASTAP
ncbi:MAG: XRE family transcriptional regulator [Pseudonocardia sp.]|nr:XRE family transcriptional regulator [Pseudonocardia sp.]